MAGCKRGGIVTYIIACGLFLSGSGTSWAQDQATGRGSASQARVLSSDSDECLEGSRSIHEITQQLALNDFGGVGQTVVGLSYSFSRCIGTSGNRWFVEASAAHVEEDAFSADAGLVGIGVEWRPFRSTASHFVVIPVVRLGREDYSGPAGATIFGAAVTVADTIPLRLQARSIEGRDVSIAATQFEWAARAEYISRDPTRTVTPGLRDNDAFVFFGSVGLDQALGRSNWRWKGSLSYQTLGGDGPVDGIASARMAFRIVNPAYTSYDWNFAITGQLGDSGFKGLIFSISRRFSH